MAIVMAAWAGFAQAQEVALAWDPSPSPSVCNYRIRFGTNSGQYTYSTNVGLVLSARVQVPHTGRWFFAATATDTNQMESDFSNEVQWEARPLPPKLRSEAWIRLVPEFLRSTNRVDWQAFVGERTWIAATNEAEFFTMSRLLIEHVPLAQKP
jgi:hypothetical protein